MACVLSCHHKHSKEPLLQQTRNALVDCMLIFNQFTKILNQERRKRCLHTILRDGNRSNGYNSFRAPNTELTVMRISVEHATASAKSLKIPRPENIKYRSHGLGLARLEKTNVLRSDMHA